MFLIYKDKHSFDNCKNKRRKLFTGGEVSVHRASCERATQPYSFGGGGKICPGSRPAGITTRSPRMVTECLFIRSMLIKMYFLFHGMCLYMYIVFTVSQFHADVHLVLLVFNVFVLHNNYVRKIWI